MTTSGEYGDLNEGDIIFLNTDFAVGVGKYSLWKVEAIEEPTVLLTNGMEGGSSFWVPVGSITKIVHPDIQAAWDVYTSGNNRIFRIMRRIIEGKVRTP